MFIAYKIHNPIPTLLSSAPQIQFIVFRAWVGIWVAIIAVCLVAAEGSTLASLLTRFSEEIFALLISLIFVYEVFKYVSSIELGEDRTKYHFMSFLIFPQFTSSHPPFSTLIPPTFIPPSFHPPWFHPDSTLFSSSSHSLPTLSHLLNLISVKSPRFFRRILWDLMRRLPLMAPRPPLLTRRWRHLWTTLWRRIWARPRNPTPIRTPVCSPPFFYLLPFSSPPISRNFATANFLAEM